MSWICNEYGLDVWPWYPALDKDYGDAKTVEFALNEWVEFDIPAMATANGELKLTWTQAPDSRGAGRGCQVAEVWLIKK